MESDEVVVSAYAGYVYAIAKTLVPRHDRADAMQDGFLAVVVAHRRFRPDLNDDEAGWIRISVRRAILDGYRRRTGYNHIRHAARPAPVSLEAIVRTLGGGEIVTAEDELPNRHFDGPDESDMIADDLAAYLRGLFAGVDLMVYDGLVAGRSQAEMAAELGVSGSRVSQRVAHIRHRVAEEIT